jgi:hypothetical protein
VGESRQGWNVGVAPGGSEFDDHEIKRILKLKLERADIVRKVVSREKTRASLQVLLPNITSLRYNTRSGRPVSA